MVQRVGEISLLKLGFIWTSDVFTSVVLVLVLLDTSVYECNLWNIYRPSWASIVHLNNMAVVAVVAYISSSLTIPVRRSSLLEKPNIVFSTCDIIFRSQDTAISLFNSGYLAINFGITLDRLVISPFWGFAIPEAIDGCSPALPTVVDGNARPGASKRSFHLFLEAATLNPMMQRWPSRVAQP